MALYTDYSSAPQYNIKHTRHCCVFVGNISYECTEDALTQIFQRCGAVEQFRILKERDAKIHKGYGFCEFKDAESADLCCRTMNGIECYGRPLRIDTADVDIKTLEMLGATRQRDFLELQAQMVGVHDVNYQAEVSGLISTLSTSEVFCALAHMQALVKNNPLEARAYLTKNPAMAHAMMHAQFLASMHSRPMRPMTRKDIDNANWNNNITPHTSGGQGTTNATTTSAEKGGTSRNGPAGAGGSSSRAGPGGGANFIREGGVSGGYNRAEGGSSSEYDHGDGRGGGRGYNYDSAPRARSGYDNAARGGGVETDYYGASGATRTMSRENRAGPLGGDYKPSPRDRNYNEGAGGATGSNGANGAGSSSGVLDKDGTGIGAADSMGGDVAVKEEPGTSGQSKSNASKETWKYEDAYPGGASSSASYKGSKKDYWNSKYGGGKDYWSSYYGGKDKSDSWSSKDKDFYWKEYYNSLKGDSSGYPSRMKGEGGGKRDYYGGGGKADYYSSYYSMKGMMSGSSSRGYGPYDR
ncbi:unnamed protein product [Amoebophrya sp. A25]|nr:unnamed protein product [Amoebophrya sp. A25]|eukprot:GSA25T00021990001.1